jgi:hypothetical protein
VRFTTVVEHAAALQFAAATPDDDDGKLGGVVSTDQHAGAHHDHGIVQGGAFPFLDGGMKLTTPLRKTPFIPSNYTTLCRT